VLAMLSSVSIVVMLLELGWTVTAAYWCAA
jgi:hypothetical protein